MKLVRPKNSVNEVHVPKEDLNFPQQVPQEVCTRAGITGSIISPATSRVRGAGQMFQCVAFDSLAFLVQTSAPGFIKQ